MGEASAMVFSNVLLAGKDRMLGELRVSGDSGFTWRAQTTGRVVTIASADVRALHWAKVRAGCQLRVGVKGGSFVRFEGLKPSEQERLKQVCHAAFGFELAPLELSCKGLSWGEAAVNGSSVTFNVDGREAFTIPLSEVAQAAIPTKNEVALEFHTADTLVPEDEALVEIRLGIPPKIADGALDDDGEATASTADDFLAQVVDRADLAITGDAMATVSDLAIAVPRGRYTVDFYAAFMKMHGKGSDYKVMYDSVVALYQLPRPDGYHISLAVHLDPPIRQGSTYYQFIILQFPREEEYELEIALSRDQLTTKYGGKLKPKMEGPMYELIGTLLGALTGKKLYLPSPDFKTSVPGVQAIKCTLKADEGTLFGFEKCFLYVNKPTTLISFDSISAVEFSRVDKSSAGASSSRSFDCTMHKKNGETITFSNMQRKEYQGLFAFLIAKKLRIKNIHKDAAALSDDEDDVAAADEADPYLDKIKRQRAGKAKARTQEDVNDALGGDDDDDDDDDDESDEDFQAGDDSDVDEEYEEEDCSDDDEGAGRGGKKKAGGASKKKRSDGDAEEDDDGDEPDLLTRKGSKGGGKEPAKKKAKKDPAEPKKPPTAFLLYSNEHRAAVKQEQPELSFGEIGKALGERWRAASDEVKAEYEQRAADAKAEYARAMKAYKADAAGKMTQRNDESDSESESDDGGGAAIVDDDE